MGNSAVALRGSINRGSVFRNQVLLFILLIAFFFHFSLTTAQAGSVTLDVSNAGDYVSIHASMGADCGSLYITSPGGSYRVDQPETEFNMQMSVCSLRKGSNTFTAHATVGWCGNATATVDVSINSSVSISEPSGIVQAPFDVSGTAGGSGYGLVDFFGLPSNTRVPSPGGFSWNATYPYWAPASNSFTTPGDHTVSVANTTCVGGNPYAVTVSRAESTFYVCNPSNCGNTPPPDPDPGNPVNPAKPGDPGQPDSDCGSSDSSNDEGWPQWRVNNVNMNLYMSDTPIWYHPSIGPAVRFRLSYNSRGAVDPTSPLGRKWQLNYASSLTENTTTGAVAITLPDGKKDVHTLNGSAYTPPLGIFNTLTKIAANHFELSFSSGTIYTYQIPAGTALSHPVMTEIKNAYGQKLTLGYNAAGLLSTVTDATGGISTLTYANGLLQQIHDPFGRTAVFGYTDGNLTSTQDMGGYQTYYEYETSANDGGVYLKAVKNSQNEAWTFKIEPPDGTPNNTILYPNAATGQKLGQNYRITITDPTGGKEEYYYMGPATWYISPRDYVPYTSTTDNNLKKAAKTIHYLDRTVGKGRIKKTTYPEGGYVKYENFDAATGKAKKITHYHGKDASNADILHIDEYTYNTKGRILTHKDPKTTTGVTTTYT